MAKCPQCGATLYAVRYRGGYFNRDQFDANRAGDWYCSDCPDNGRGNSGLAYFWDREIKAEAPANG